jgi:hypothetical protein
VAGVVHGVQRRDSPGGSLQLSGVIDEFGEEIYFDLLEHFQFDLVEFLAGERNGSPRLILAMLRHLPESSRYAAALTSAPEVAGDSDIPEAPAEIDPAQEARVWNTDRQLMAQLINSVNTLVRHTIPWEQGNAPKLPLVGPAAWRGEGPNAAPKPTLSVMDVINKVTGKHGR